MKLLLILPALLLSASCVMPGDIADLRASMDLRDEQIDETLGDFAEGSITSADMKAEIQTANDDLAEAFDAKVDEVQERGSTFLSSLPSTGSSPVDLILGIGGMLATSVFTTNKVRDKRRRMRGEPVGATPTVGAVAPTPPA